MRLLVTRPEPDGSAQVRLLTERGHEALLAPLSQVEFFDGNLQVPDDLQAIIATSRNALRALSRLDALEGLLDVPLFAVGRATARLASDIGFIDVRQGGGTAKQLVAPILSQCNPDKGALLHPAGEKLAWDLKSELEKGSFIVLQPVVYRSGPVARLPDRVIEAFRSRTLDGVILMSPESARNYVALIHSNNFEAEAARLTCYCLSNAIAKALEGLSGARLKVAKAPTQDDLLALIGQVAAH